MNSRVEHKEHKDFVGGIFNHALHGFTRMNMDGFISCCMDRDLIERVEFFGGGYDTAG